MRPRPTTIEPLPEGHLDLAEEAARNIKELESSGRLVNVLRDQRRSLLEAIAEIGKSSIAEAAILRALAAKPKSIAQLKVSGNAYRLGLVDSFERAVKRLLDEGAIEIAFQTSAGTLTYRLTGQPKPESSSNGLRCR